MVSQDEHATPVRDAAGRTDQVGAHPKTFVLEISGDQVITPPTAANVNLGSDGTYQVTVGVERVKKAGLGEAGIRLNSP